MLNSLPKKFEQILAFCLTTPNSPKRKKLFLNLKKIIPHLKSFPAIMGKDLTKQEIKDYLKLGILNKKTIAFSLAGEIGCYLSHLTMLEKFVKSQKELCLIIEDDIILAEDVQNYILRALGNSPDYWDLLYIYINACNKKNCAKIPNKKYWLNLPNEGIYGTVGYLVNKNGAKKIIKNSRPMDVTPIDINFINLFKSNKIQVFVTAKTLSNTLGDSSVVEKGDIPSEIQHSKVLPIFFLWQFILRILYIPYFFLLSIPIKIFLNRWLPFQQYGIRKFKLWKLSKKYRS